MRKTIETSIKIQHHLENGCSELYGSNSVFVKFNNKVQYQGETKEHPEFIQLRASKLRHPWSPQIVRLADMQFMQLYAHCLNNGSDDR